VASEGDLGLVTSWLTHRRREGFLQIITILTSLYRSGNGDDRSVGASDGSDKGATLILQSAM
jgi:hypothetical protein